MFNRRLCMTVAIVFIFSFSTVLYATPGGTSISINFGADEPDGARSDVTGAAGLAGTVNWNNLDLASGTADALTLDVLGAPVAGTASVTWESANTWSSTGRGEENNTAPPGNDRNLMTGYLDTNATDPTTVTVTGLDGEFSAGYNVAIYIQGGVNGRGGQYTITTDNKVATLALTNDAPFDGTYVPGGFAGNNYLVMDKFVAPEFTLSALPVVGGGSARAPINAIEIVAIPIPEPSTLMLTALGFAGLLAFRRRRLG